MSPADTRRGITASRGATQLSLFAQAPTLAGGSVGPPPDPTTEKPAAPTSACHLPEGASLWAVSFVGDSRMPRECLAWAAARYRDRFGRAHALVALPLAELEAYRAAGIEAIGDGRLAGGCLYLLHPPGASGHVTEEAT